MGEETYMLPYKMDIDEKIFILSQCSLLIGMRLHALVFCRSQNSMVGISYDRKLIRFKSSESASYRECGWRMECWYLYEIAKSN